MNLQIFFSAFATIFIAELGDKTQLATLAMASSQPGAKWQVFFGASLALVCTTFIGLVAANLVNQWISPETLKRVAGIAFVALGLWYLKTSF